MICHWYWKPTCSLTWLPHLCMLWHLHVLWILVLYFRVFYFSIYCFAIYYAIIMGYLCFCGVFWVWIDRSSDYSVSVYFCLSWPALNALSFCRSYPPVLSFPSYHWPCPSPFDLPTTIFSFVLFTRYFDISSPSTCIAVLLFVDGWINNNNNWNCNKRPPKL